MTALINRQIRRWLESGETVPALLGRVAFFLPSPTYGDHDRGLLLSQLLIWAEEGHLTDAAQAFEDAVTQSLLEGADADALDLMWSYVLVSRNRGTALPLSTGFLEAGLAHVRARGRLAGSKRIEELEVALAAGHPQQDGYAHDIPQP